jgi:hypothetical protein
MSQAFEVDYVAYKGNSVEVLAEGKTIVNAASRMQAEDTVKAQFGYGNNVVIRSVFSA